MKVTFHVEQKDSSDWFGEVGWGLLWLLFLSYLNPLGSLGWGWFVFTEFMTGAFWLGWVFRPLVCWIDARIKEGLPVPAWAKDSILLLPPADCGCSCAHCQACREEGNSDEIYD